MKTTILADGTLSVAPESDLEAYALQKWCEENIADRWQDAARQHPKITVDLSEYAARMRWFVAAPQS